MLIYAAVRRVGSSGNALPPCSLLPSLEPTHVSTDVFTWRFARPHQPLVPAPRPPKLPARLPGARDIVAMDAEFVATSTQVDEILPDGQRIVHKSSRQAPGRVSVVSADGEVLLDEYIEVTEPIVDYLTRFSGLAAGDLNPQTSPHRLCSLKVRESEQWAIVSQQSFRACPLQRG